MRHFVARGEETAYISQCMTRTYTSTCIIIMLCRSGVYNYITHIFCHSGEQHHVLEVHVKVMKCNDLASFLPRVMDAEDYGEDIQKLKGI